MCQEQWQLRSLIVSALAAISAAGATIYAAKQVKSSRKQLEHTSEVTFTSLSNEHNWLLFDHCEDLPPALPSWFHLENKQDWAWRILHFNHLNLLKLFWRDIEEDTERE